MDDYKTINMPLVTIVIPVYNAEKYVNRCIDSVINQTYAQLDIIIIDDGSNDKTGLLLDKYTEIDSRITIIHKKINEGVSAARNTGINIAKGQLISFCDCDDYYDLDRIEKMVSIWMKTPGCNLVSSDYRFIFEYC